jgi:hypothetical protein
MEDDSITDGDKTITGREGCGQVHLDETSDGLNIYVARLGKDENQFGGELADALAEHLGINEKAKLLFQKVMTSDDLSYLLDKEFLWEGINLISNVSQDDNLKGKGSASHYARSVGEIVTKVMLGIVMRAMTRKMINMRKTTQYHTRSCNLADKTE